MTMKRCFLFAMSCLFLCCGQKAEAAVEIDEFYVAEGFETMEEEQNDYCNIRYYTNSSSSDEKFKAMVDSWTQASAFAYDFSPAQVETCTENGRETTYVWYEYTGDDEITSFSYENEDIKIDSCAVLGIIAYSGNEPGSTTAMMAYSHEFGWQLDISDRKSDKKKEADKTAASEKTPKSIPLFNEIFTDLKVEDVNDGSGNLHKSYSGFENGEEAFDRIDQYIEILEEYGYTLLKSEKVSNSFYDYYLDCSDDSLEKVVFRDQKSHIVIEGLINESLYNFIYVDVIYSPTVFGEGGEQPEAVRNQGGTSGGNSSSDDRSYRIPCVRCSGGKVPCTACNGRGGKEVKDHSTPNYSGSTSFYSGSSTWEECYKCHGSKEQDCKTCNGTGWVDVG